MALLEVLHYPEPVLREVAQPVMVFDEKLATLVSSMFETLHHCGAVGLAANQVGVLQRIVVIDISPDYNQPLCLINPEIVDTWGVQSMNESCLSFPGLRFKITRKQGLRVKACNERGEPFELDAEGLLAECIEHEIDHLNGVLFIDYLSAWKCQRQLKRYDKLQKRLNKA